MGRALDNGVTQTELSEIIAHVLWYSGFPTGVNAARVAAEVFAERNLPAIPTEASPRQPPQEPELEFPDAYPQAPYLRDLLNQVLYAETWKRNGIISQRSKHDYRSSRHRTLRLQRSSISRRQGVGQWGNQDEISEIITHVTFYSGFPTGVNASRVAAEVFESRSLLVGDERFPGAPYLDDLIDGLVYGETWNRNQLSVRDRSLRLSLSRWPVISQTSCVCTCSVD